MGAPSFARETKEETILFLSAGWGGRGQPLLDSGVILLLEPGEELKPDSVAQVFGRFV
jgi:hypothetical protein